MNDEDVKEAIDRFEKEVVERVIALEQQGVLSAGQCQTVNDVIEDMSDQYLRQWLHLE